MFNVNKNLLKSFSVRGKRHYKGNFHIYTKGKLYFVFVIVHCLLWSNILNNLIKSVQLFIYIIYCHEASSPALLSNYQQATVPLLSNYQQATVPLLSNYQQATVCHCYQTIITLIYTLADNTIQTIAIHILELSLASIDPKYFLI